MTPGAVTDVSKLGDRSRLEEASSAKIRYASGKNFFENGNQWIDSTVREWKRPNGSAFSLTPRSISISLRRTRRRCRGLQSVQMSSSPLAKRFMKFTSKLFEKRKL